MSKNGKSPTPGNVGDRPVLHVASKYDGVQLWVSHNHPFGDIASIQKPYFTIEYIRNNIKRGDIVVGLVPLRNAALVCEQGARLFDVQMTLPQGVDFKNGMTEQDVRMCGPQLVEYFVSKVEQVNAEK